MPELPEVEMVARSLGPLVRGRTVAKVWTSGFGLRLRRAVDVVALRDVLLGKKLGPVKRMGKQVVLEVVGGGNLIVHLGMTGRLMVAGAASARAPHTHVALTFVDGQEMRFVDPRRFGWVEAVAKDATLEGLRSLGPDPLTELSVEGLAEALARSRAPLKSFLLDQRKIAGLGNIYVCEALFRARLHPSLPALRARTHAPKLLAAIQAALRQGIANGGTTLRDYVDAEGRKGDNAKALLVYGREGEACTVCAKSIRREVQAGRSTFFCAVCQRAPKL